jgi:hypothetical protein
MEFNVRDICGKYQEMTVTELDTGALDNKESISTAIRLISAAEDLLWRAKERNSSDACGSIVEELTDRLIRRNN